MLVILNHAWLNQISRAVKFLSLFISTFKSVSSHFSLQKCVNIFLVLNIGLDSTIVDIVYPEQKRSSAARDRHRQRRTIFWLSDTFTCYSHNGWRRRSAHASPAPPLYRRHYTKHSRANSEWRNAWKRRRLHDDERRVGTYLKGFQAYLKWLRIPHFPKLTFRKKVH